MIEKQVSEVRVPSRTYIAENGYTNVKEMPNGSLCALLPFAFTWGLVVGLEEHGYSRRYCFEHFEDALESLASWDGEGHPGGNWIKCKGAGIDLLNPNLAMENNGSQ
jgi:hypothetical protein